MKLTANHIDKACRDGLYVFVGNRERIFGCDVKHNGVPAETGKVWIHMSADLSWRQVSVTQISIDHPKGEPEMPKGKGRPGAVSHISSKRPSRKQQQRANSGNFELEGMDPENRRIAAIEDAEEARQAASQQISVAQRDYEEAEKAVIKAMHANGYDPIKKPVYTRAPWGSVTLQQTGEVKEKVKFTEIKKQKASKKSEE